MSDSKKTQTVMQVSNDGHSWHTVPPGFPVEQLTFRHQRTIEFTRGEVDYRELLIKYMRHVGSEEGIDFTDRLQAMEEPSMLTQQEVCELQSLSASLSDH